MEKPTQREVAEVSLKNLEPLAMFGTSPLDRLMKRAGLRTHSSRLVLFWACVTWLPLLLLSLIGGQADVQVTFFQDFPVHIRLLVALTILLVAESLVEQRLSSVIPIFIERAIVHDGNASRVSRAVTRTRALARSGFAEAMIILLAFIFIQSQAVIELTAQITTWKSSGATSAQAHFWYRWVSLVIYHFFLFRWLWKYLIWSYFLLLMTNTRLALQSYHPDRGGGIGFLISRHVEFGVIATAISAVLAANIANMTLHGERSLAEFWIPLIAYLFTAGVVYFMPLLAFTPSLVRAKRRGLRDYGRLASRHTIEFEKRWSGTSAVSGENPLGNPDLSSHTDLNSSYDHLYEMRLILLNRRHLQALIAYIVLPLLPLAILNVPLLEVFQLIMKALI